MYCVLLRELTAFTTACYTACTVSVLRSPLHSLLHTTQLMYCYDIVSRTSNTISIHYICQQQIPTMHTTLVERSSLTTSSVCILVGRYCALLHTSMHDTYSGVEYTQRGKHTQYIYYIQQLDVVAALAITTTGCVVQLSVSHYYCVGGCTTAMHLYSLPSTVQRAHVLCLCPRSPLHYLLHTHTADVLLHVVCSTSITISIHYIASSRYSIAQITSREITMSLLLVVFYTCSRYCTPPYSYMYTTASYGSTAR